MLIQKSLKTIDDCEYPIIVHDSFQMFNCTIDSNTCVATDNVEADLYKVTFLFEKNPMK